MRTLVVLTALLGLAAEARDRRCVARNRTGDCASYAFFEAFPASGAGTTTACSTTAPTGARGEVLTFTRTGNATCSKQGPATTGINDGDLVVLSGDIPRVSSVSGLLMFLRESARTNSLLRSQEWNNAAWGNDAAGVAVPTVTADQATAPDGTLTAERLQVPATNASGTQYSARTQTATMASGVGVCSAFIKGNGTSGTIDVCQQSSGSGCSACAYVADSWTRCAAPASANATTKCWFGNMSLAAYNGNVARGAQDVFVWGGQLEAGAWMTGYIPTVAAAASRQAESALSTTLTTGIGPSFSVGVTTAYTSASVTTATALQLGSGAPNLASVGRNSNTAAAFTVNATSTTPAVSAMGTSVLRGSLNDASGTRTAWWNGGSVSAPAASMSASTTAISFGALDAYTGRACADPTPARCDL